MAEETGKKNDATVAKKKKISRMSVQEIEKELKQVQEKMGGLSSVHAQQLVKRKRVCAGQ
jgi:hypothetical protein